MSNAGLRGLLATRDIKQGDIVIAVPVNTSMDIGPTEWTSGFHFPHWTSPVRSWTCLAIFGMQHLV